MSSYPIFPHNHPRNPLLDSQKETNSDKVSVTAQATLTPDHLASAPPYPPMPSHRVSTMSAATAAAVDALMELFRGRRK